MKIRRPSLLLVVLLSLTTGCGTLEQMTCLINQSTEAICSNSQAIEYDTEVIHQNIDVTTASTKTVKENRHQLESAND